MIREFDFLREPLAPGLNVLEASAGTGKTFTISHIIPCLLLDGAVSHVGEILLVTYTNDAAAELASRVRSVIEILAAPPAADEPDKQPGIHAIRKKFPSDVISRTMGRALRQLDRLAVSTIHSFCMRVLQTEGVLCGWPVAPELVPDAREETTELLLDDWETRIAGDPELASLARAAGWNIARQIEFLRSALPLSNPEFMPEPRAFQSLIKDLRESRGIIAAGDFAGLEDALNGCPKWNKGALEDADERSALFARVSKPGRALSVELFDDWRLLASIPGWIPKRSADARALAVALEKRLEIQAAGEAMEKIRRSEWDYCIEMLQNLRERVAGVLRAAGKVTYDGLLESVHRALTAGDTASASLRGALRQRYKAALIDESQDTDPRQFEIFHSIFCGESPGRPMAMIGDPKQAIYAFRGADVNTYLAARERAGERVFRLTRTFRAPQPLVDCVNALFCNEGAFLKDGLDCAPATSGVNGNRVLEEIGGGQTAPMEFWISPDAEDPARPPELDTSDSRKKYLARVTAGEIARLLESKARLNFGAEIREVRPADFAVLVSTHNEAEAVQDALGALGIPAVRGGGADIMASEEAAELLTLLRSVAEPRRTGWLRAALATRLLGWNAAQIAGLDSGTGAPLLETFARLREDVWETNGVAALLARLDEDHHILVRLAALPDGERRVTNFRQLTELLQNHASAGARSPEDILRWLELEVAEAGSRADAEERQLRLESDEEAVRILTMHTAKGLEFPLVFCPFLWNPPNLKGPFQRLPGAGGTPVLVNKELLPDAAAEPVELARLAMEDRLRLAYVAITRARVKVWIIAGENAGRGKAAVPASALDWLLRGGENPDFASWAAAAAGAGRAKRHSAALERLRNLSKAPIDCRSLPAPFCPGGKLEAPHRTSSFSALSPPVIPRPWVLASFSGITREKHPHGPPAADEVPAPGHKPDAPNAFFGAPGGTLVGTAVHEWIEKWDFTQPSQAALETHFSLYGLGKDCGVPPFPHLLADMLDHLRETVLPGLRRPVGEVCGNPAASEWQFHLPLRPGFSTGKLAAIFESNDCAAYARSLRELSPGQIDGYLQGFLDRIACDGDRYGVIDWKTNRLPAYDPDSLLQCACRSHYFLQTHLYIVALRRFFHGRARIADAWLVFLRGVRSGSAEGVLHIAPPEKLLSELDGLFDSPDP